MARNRKLKQMNIEMGRTWTGNNYNVLVADKRAEEHAKQNKFQHDSIKKIVIDNIKYQINKKISDDTSVEAIIRKLSSSQSSLYEEMQEEVIARTIEMVKIMDYSAKQKIQNGESARLINPKKDKLRQRIKREYGIIIKTLSESSTNKEHSDKSVESILKIDKFPKEVRVMPHLPGSRLDSKKINFIMNAAKETKMNKNASAMAKNMEDERRAQKSFRDKMIRKYTLSSTMHYVKKLQENGVTDMYEIVRSLKSKPTRDVILRRISNTVKIMDGKNASDRKINPESTDLTKQIECSYRRYLIELLVKFEIERLRRANWPDEKIIKLLNQKYYSLDMEIQRDIRSVVEDLYVADFKDSGKKVKEETRQIMADMATEIEVIR